MGAFRAHCDDFKQPGGFSHDSATTRPWHPEELLLGCSQFPSPLVSGSAWSGG